MGVSGEASYIGGYFKSQGIQSYGVYSEATGAYGIAVFGTATNPGAGANYGGFFAAEGTSGVGVKGISYGSHGEGVKGEAHGANGTGVYGYGGAYDFYAGNPGSINYGSASSVRWKSNIRAIGNPLDKILQLRGVYFDWDTEHGGGHDMGMIAEEVGEVLPEIVVYEENGVDATGMDYSKVTPLLVEAVKELKGENDRLKERVEALERTIHQLAKVKELEL
jgi:hypothetical protein